MNEFIKNNKLIELVVYIVLGIIIYSVIRIVINKIIKRVTDKKKITIISLIKNIIKYLIVALIVLAILNLYGINTSGILASIGIVGVIIGLALQDVITDFLAGIAILFDDKYTIGDVVLINDFKGVVIGFGLMSTKIKASTGEVKIISNSSFKEVINYSHNNTILFVKLNVSYDTDIERMENVLKNMDSDVRKINNVCGKYQLLGIDEFSDRGISYLISIECKPEKQYQVKRDYLKMVRDKFIDEDIKLSHQIMDVLVRERV